MIVFSVARSRIRGKAIRTYKPRICGYLKKRVKQQERRGERRLNPVFAGISRLYLRKTPQETKRRPTISYGTTGKERLRD